MSRSVVFVQLLPLFCLLDSLLEVRFQHSYLLVEPVHLNVVLFLELLDFSIVLLLLVIQFFLQHCFLEFQLLYLELQLLLHLFSPGLCLVQLCCQVLLSELGVVLDYFFDEQLLAVIGPQKIVHHHNKPSF